jgi:hypothetical protein
MAGNAASHLRKVVILSIAILGDWKTVGPTWSQHYSPISGEQIDFEPTCQENLSILADSSISSDRLLLCARNMLTFPCNAHFSMHVMLTSPFTATRP